MTDDEADAIAITSGHACFCQRGQAAIAVPVTGTYLVVDGVITEDPDDRHDLLKVFGCLGGCR